MVQFHLGAHMPDISPQSFSVTAEDAGKRLDIFLAEKMAITRSAVQKQIDRNGVHVNDAEPKKAGQKLKEGDAITIVQIEEAVVTPIIPDTIDIVAETDEYIVINKPTGILSHPTMAKETGTVIDWLRHYYPAVEGVGEDPLRPGMMHRLDREASGLLVLAKTQAMFDHLKTQFKDRTVEKEYSVLVYGVVDADHDVIDFDIDRKKDGKMAARPKVDLLKLKNVGKEQEGKDAKTEFWVQQRYTRHTLLRVKIHTGRTHQIRVHMLAYGYPVVGDVLYKNVKLIKKSDEKVGRLFLHAKKLGFADLSGTSVAYEAPMPKQLEDFVETLK